MSVQAVTDHTRIRPRPDVMGCELGEGLALLDTRSGTYFQLNDVGAQVWNMLDGRTVADIAAGVAQAYDLPGERTADVRADVRAVVLDMLESGLVQADDAIAA